MIKLRLTERIGALEAAMVASNPACVRYGWATEELPSGYRGETHLVAVNCAPSDSSRVQWCEFVERPGAAPELHGVLGARA